MYQKVYFQATTPQTSLSQSISAVHSIRNAEMNIVLTAGTDMRIRYWNLKSPQDSYIVAGGSSEIFNPSHVTYRLVQQCTKRFERDYHIYDQQKLISLFFKFLWTFLSRSKLVDGTEVIQEIHAKPKTSLVSGPPPGMMATQNTDLNANKPGLEPPSQGKFCKGLINVKNLLLL